MINKFSVEVVISPKYNDNVDLGYTLLKKPGMTYTELSSYKNSQVSSFKYFDISYVVYPKLQSANSLVKLIV